MYPKIYIINLESSTDRRNYMDGQFTALSAQYPNIQLDIHYFPAVHGIKNPDHPVFKKYNGQKVLIKNINPVGNDQYVVTTEIQSDNSNVPYKVEYRVKRTDGQYKVRDIIAEGVSMINTQRSDFGGIVAERGISALNQDLLAKAK